MSDSKPHVRTLFRSDLIHAFDYRCAGHDDEGEIPQGYEITLPRSGAYQRRDAHGSFLADPNHILFYNKGEPYDTRHLIQGGDSSTVFLFAPSLLIEMIRTYNPAVENNPQKIFQRSHITLRAQLQILQYRLLRANKYSSVPLVSLNGRIETSRIDPLEMEEKIITAVGEIIDALYQGLPARQNRSSSNTLRAHADQTHAVKTFLNARVQSRLQLEHISSAVHLSPYHLCRVFKQNMGMSLHQYVKRLRLFNAAERMLEDPAARLDLLALDYGFSNHGNFSTAFRKMFGVNPSELRGSRHRQMSKILKA